MIQHTYDVLTLNDGNKIIRGIFSGGYEMLGSFLIDFPELMEEGVDIVLGGEVEKWETGGNVYSADIEKDITVIT